ncbi:MAG: hypothetical protein FWE88_02225 [Phycisphaerae bacterium]|nr:hypothetical protein [Phycisphaerae bacterium]
MSNRTEHRNGPRDFAKALCVGVLLLAVAAGAAAQDEATTTAPATSADDALRQRLAQLAGEAASDDDAVRAQACQTLIRLQDAMVASLAPHLADDDPEVRARVGALLAEMRREVRVTRTLNAIGPEQRTQLAALQKTHGPLCQAMLGASERDKLAALHEVRRLCGGKDAQAFEPLALLGLHSRFASVQAAAIDVIQHARYTATPIVERLTDFALASEAKGFGQFVHLSTDTPATPWLALHTLKTLGASHTSARLAVAAYRANRFRDNFSHRALFLAEAAEAGGDKALLPALMTFMDANASKLPVNASEGFYQLPADSVLYMLLMLSGQSIDDYKLHAERASDTYGKIGFATQDERVAAYEKINTWWENNKTSPDFQSLTPTPLALPSTGNDGNIETSIMEFIE